MPSLKSTVGLRLALSLSTLFPISSAIAFSISPRCAISFFHTAKRIFEGDLRRQVLLRFCQDLQLLSQPVRCPLHRPRRHKSVEAIS